MKICAISDTHTKHHELKIPECDIIIHAGDASHNEVQFMHFIEWYSELPIKYKIFVAGNHDHAPDNYGYEKTFEFLKERGIIYLEDTNVNIEGIVIHGSPWSVQFGNYSFMADDFDLQEAWDKISPETNILVTHGPAYKRLDKVNNDWIKDRDTHVGSKTLTETIDNLRQAGNLKVHICGHIHESYGRMIHKDYTTYNCSIYEYNGGVKKPVVFEI